MPGGVYNRLLAWGVPERPILAPLLGEKAARH